jgi:hypothetical protein
MSSVYLVLNEDEYGSYVVKVCSDPEVARQYGEEFQRLSDDAVDPENFYGRYRVQEKPLTHTYTPIKESE